MDNELKYRHEKFIHGNHGSNEPWEIFQLIIIVQISHILFESLIFAIPILRKIKNNNDKQSPIILLNCIDFLLIYSPFILSVTILNEYITLILITMLILIIFNFLIYLKFNNNNDKICWKSLNEQLINYPDIKKISYISNIMSSLLLATCISIFAVDFQSFNRRFSKTEMYGWSLMDIGVGCFIAINGALSPDSRLINNNNNNTNTKTIFYSTVFKKTLRTSIPLLICGLIRLIAVKSINYQEHVTEYGIHWNFFFTISLVKILSSIICKLFAGKNNLYKISIILMILQQIMLKIFGTQFILDSSNRSMNIFTANKEGFLSLPGFIAIYLFFVQLGRKYIPKREKLNEFLTIIIEMIIIFLKSLIIMFSSNHLLENVSRREANLSFICFIICCSCINVIVEIIYFFLLQILKPNFLYESFIFNLINHNGLFIFLFANLLTGLVNLSIDTMIVKNSISVLLIHLYAILLSIFGYIFDKIFIFNKKTLI